MTSAQPARHAPARRAHDASIKLAWQTALIIALLFAAVAPTLSWPQFSGDSEDLLVQTVLQIRNSGPWWIPMLGDEPRSKKPPLPTWISAAAVTSATVHDLASTDPSTRESAYRWLAWEVRWPSLLAACGMLIAIAFTAYLIGGPAHVIPSVLILGTSLMFLRYTRSATTDVHLALWVMAANAFLAAAIFRNRIWLGCLGAGASLGLALMCKGPVALVETLLPIATFLLLRRWTTRRAVRSTLDFDELNRVAPSRRIALPVIAGTLVMLAIALPWPLSVYLRHPRTLRIWLTEIDRHGASIPSHAPIFAYAVLLPNLLPWLPIFIAGFYLISLQLKKLKPITLALLLVIVPILFMSFFPDRKERYLLPMAGPAAIVAAHAATRMKRAFPPKNVAAKLVWGSYWLILLIMAAGVPMAANVVLKDREGAPCYSFWLVAITLISSLVIVVGGMLMQSKSRQSFLFSGTALMLVLNAFFMFGWSRSTMGLSEMKPVADRLHAALPLGRIVYFDPPPDGKPATYDLDIYLDRPVPVVADFPVDDGNTAAVVMLRKDGDPVPDFMGWRIWNDLISRKHHWYMLTPASTATKTSMDRPGTARPEP